MNHHHIWKFISLKSQIQRNSNIDLDDIVNELKVLQYKQPQIALDIGGAEVHQNKGYIQQNKHWKAIQQYKMAMKEYITNY